MSNANNYLSGFPQVPSDRAISDQGFPRVPEDRAVVKRIPVTYRDELVKAAINFAVNPTSTQDFKEMTLYLKQASDYFEKNLYVMDNKEIALAAVATYLIGKTKKSGGKQTLRNRRRYKPTRKHRTM